MSWETVYRLRSLLLSFPWMFTNRRRSRAALASRTARSALARKCKLELHTAGANKLRFTALDDKPWMKKFLGSEALVTPECPQE